MRIKRLATLFLSLIVGVSAFAFDFTGKTFKANDITENGQKVSTTFAFRANNRATGTMTQGGKRVYSGTFYWEVSGQYINLTDPNTGQTEYLEIDQDCDNSGNCEVVLVIKNIYNGKREVTFRQVKSAASSSSAKKSSKKRR